MVHTSLSRDSKAILCNLLFALLISVPTPTSHEQSGPLRTCRAFASWKEFLALSSHKSAMLERASKACFASSMQRAWTTWQAHVHRLRVLRKALEGRQVSSLIMPLPLTHYPRGGFLS